MKNGVESEGSETRASDELLSAAAPKPLAGVPRDDSRTVSFVNTPRDGSSSSGAAEDDQTVISQRPVAAPEEFFRSMPLAELAAMLEGKQLDHFSVDTMIGGGGMGAVFRGIDTRLDRVVAVKVIPASKRDPETLRRFRLEAQAAARLDHPNIARVYYVGEAEQWNYIVFEFIDGINVRDLVEMEGPLSVDDAVFYTRQVAEALQHAHDRDVVHRDVKPSNVLVTANGIAKLVDMGLARNTALDKSAADATASGVTLGTFDYISPEQARNPRDADVRSDLYSLGCTLFYMLTGHPPFPEGTALQKLLNHGSQPPPDPRSWREDLSDQLYEVMMKLMAKRPADRYQKPAELVNDLLLLAEIEDLPRSQGPTTLMINPTIAQRSLLETNLPWMVALAFLLGSTLWLQSFQSLSNGFALQELKFDVPAEEAEDSLADSEPPLPAPSPLPVRGTEESAASLAVESDTTESPIRAGSPPPPVTNPDAPATATGDAERPAPQNGTTGSTPAPAAKPTVDLPVLDAAATQAQAAAAPAVIVVAQSQPADVSAEAWEVSLAQAIERAASGSSTIEVRGTVRVSRAIVLKGKSLLIRGSRGNPATIEFGSSLLDGLEGKSAVQIQDGELRLSELAIRSAAPRPLSAPACLFDLSGQSSLTVEGSSLTVDGSGPATFCLFGIGTSQLLSEVGAASGASSRSNGGLVSNERSTEAARSIVVAARNSVFRGDCSIVGVRQNSVSRMPRLEVSFEDVLVAVAGVAFDLQAPTSANGTERFVRLFCKQSTFVTSQGFARLAFQGSGSPAIGFNRTSQSCVYWSPADIPHIAISGERASLLDNPNLLLLQGYDNAYDENIENICQTFANGTGIFDLGFVDGQQEGWLTEKGSERMVRWEKPLTSDLSFADARLSAFKLVEGMFVPGFRNDSLLPPRVE